MSAITIWSVLFNPPQNLIPHQTHQSQPLLPMIAVCVAPHYKLKSLTTLIMAITLIIYITLVIPHPPFLRIPAFALQSIKLQPQHLRHYQFYRLFTAPFVYQQLTNLLLGLLLVWCLGSYTQEGMGWRMLVIFSGLWGLIGASNSFSIPMFLIGCKFSDLVIKWADPLLPIPYRKVILVVYLIMICIFILFFWSYQRQQQFNFYSSALYGFMMASILGSQNGSPYSTFRKLLASFCLIVLILISSYLFLDIVFNGKTFV